MGQFVQGGHLLSLETYADRFGWGARFPQSILNRMQYSAVSGRFGEGALYGLPQTASIVGFFYDQQTLDQFGEEPATWDDLFSLLDGVRGAGAQPMVLGNLERWPAFHVLGPLQPAFLPSAEAVALALGSAAASWDSDGSIQALEQLAEWAAEGYFGDSPNSTDYDTAWRAFADGKAAFLPADNALAADLEAEMGEGLRFMAPPVGQDGTRATTGGTGVPWSIPAAAANPQVAAAYLDFITSEAAMATIAASGAMPVLRTAELAPEAGVNRDIFQAFTAVTEAGTLVPFLDEAGPTFLETAGTELQALIGGQKDPLAVALALQAEHLANG